MWDGCDGGDGAPPRQYSGEVLDLGSGAVVLTDEGEQGLGHYYRVDAASGEVAFSIPQPLRGIGAAFVKQSNHTLRSQVCCCCDAPRAFSLERHNSLHKLL